MKYTQIDQRASTVFDESWLDKSAASLFNTARLDEAWSGFAQWFNNAFANDIKDIYGSQRKAMRYIRPFLASFTNNLSQMKDDKGTAITAANLQDLPLSALMTFVTTNMRPDSSALQNGLQTFNKIASPALPEPLDMDDMKSNDSIADTWGEALGQGTQQAAGAEAIITQFITTVAMAMARAQKPQTGSNAPVTPSTGAPQISSDSKALLSQIDSLQKLIDQIRDQED